MNNTMNILMAVNKKYVVQMKTMLCSLGCNNDCQIDVYLMHTELAEDTIEGLKSFVSKWCRGDLHEIKVENSFLKDAKLLLHFSIEMYYRIFASEYLPNTLDRILWLDADIIVNGSIKEFYNSEFYGKSIIACAHREKDEGNPIVSKESNIRLNLDNGIPYFNSGVILMNLIKIRKCFAHEAVCGLIEENRERLNYPDQDILNILYQKDMIFADKNKYNYQVHHNWVYDSEKQVVNEAKIIHYAGPVKPWGYNTYHFSYEYYWRYYLMFGERRIYCTHLIKQKAYSAYKHLKKIMRGK